MLRDRYEPQNIFKLVPVLSLKEGVIGCGSDSFRCAAGMAEVQYLVGWRTDSRETSFAGSRRMPCDLV